MFKCMRCTYEGNDFYRHHTSSECNGITRDGYYGHSALSLVICPRCGQIAVVLPDESKFKKIPPTNENPIWKSINKWLSGK